ncbi:hypothetical protein APR41_06805 [Salegentibacter salinarum]|uniref:Macroglobulin domain-containing protein n=1 Tax=Salegentibacter salinarum TaxID=447422 RepID=A0A2N0TQX0_9FLAO|nr:hypothetical protein [Salegentibacter salinarum]PKD17137.1 hypothetical protein APR41_06805 [Salegentibacter salinarum]SKB55505.1 hypothetical protein SAMN05660903_01386 [Salegentibacter salinarum]
MVKKIYIFLFSVLFVNVGNAQIEDQENFLQNEVLKEQVYLHLNSSLLFSGEKLLYKFYCLDSETRKLSELSKTGWVVLVNSDKEQVFKHKLQLRAGQAYSDFFIPSNLPSGAYKILAYTAWMLNAEDNYFEQDVYILNPYQSENKGLILKDSIATFSQNITVEKNTSNFNLKLNKSSFSSRELVTLTSDGPSKLNGNFSISVRRKNNLKKPELLNSTNFNESYENINWDFSDTLIFPEVRGSLITGKVIRNDDQQVSNNLIVSFPGEENQLNIISTKENGEFNFTIDQAINEEEVLIQIANNQNNDYSIELKQNPQPDLGSLNFETPEVYQGFKEYILEKSINNQIENAYSATKADRTIFHDNSGYFFEENLEKFNLDDYTRFPEVTQTFVEIIENGRVKRNADGSHSILVRNKNTNGEFTLPALLVLDGVVIQDHDKLVSFDAEGIESIGLLRNKFFFGPEIYQGVVVVETIEGNFPEVFRDDTIKSQPISTTQNPKKYYSPDYQSENLERIPDYRTQLWWNPTINFEPGKKHLKFYTSDLTGEFEINLQGFTDDGEPVSLKKYFRVE